MYSDSDQDEENIHTPVPVKCLDSHTSMSDNDSSTEENYNSNNNKYISKHKRYISDCETDTSSSSDSDTDSDTTERFKFKSNRGTVKKIHKQAVSEKSISTQNTSTNMAEFPNVHLQYYITDASSITSFVATEYCDYLMEIDDCNWKKCKMQIMKSFWVLPIDNIQILNLFMEKLGITILQLIRNIKKCPSNQKLTMCCMVNYYEEFIENITKDDVSFFRNSLLYCDLEFNKYVYYEIFPKVKSLFGNENPYEKFFCSNSDRFLKIEYFDVFEYFIKLFETNILKCSRRDDRIIIRFLCDICFDDDDDDDDELCSYQNQCVEKLINPCCIVKRLVDISNINITDIKNSLNTDVEHAYKNYEVYCVSIRSCSNFDGVSLVKNLVVNNCIDELIELFDYVNFDLGKQEMYSIIGLLLDVMFSNDPNIVGKFVKYLKRTVGHMLNISFYDTLLKYITMRGKSYPYLRFANNNTIILDKSITNGIVQLKYAGSIIEFERK